MKHHNPARRLMAAAAALTLLPPAATTVCAASSAEVTVGPLRAEIIDLRPEDGQAAGAQFDVKGVEAGVAASTATTYPLNHELIARYGSWRGAGTHATSFTGHASASASVSGGGATGPTGVTAVLHGNTPSFVAIAGSQALYGAQVSVSDHGAMMAFTLTPWSSLVLSIDVSARVSSTGVDDSGVAEVFLNLESSALAQPSSETFSLACGGSCTASETGMLSVTLVNDTDTILGGSWSLVATVNGLGFAAPVPEPAPAVLLLAGMAALGWTRSRHRG